MGEIIGVIILLVLIAISIYGEMNPPKCKECGEDLEDHGYEIGGISFEPCFICVNKECNKN